MARILLPAALAMASLAATPSRAITAEFNAKDGQILGRTLAFVGDGLTGTVVVGVVFLPSSSSSRAEAEAIRSIVGDGVTAGRVNLQARLIPIGQVAEASGIGALYVTTDLAGSMGTVAAAAERLHIPTVSANLECVRSGACVLGFSTEPTVQIIIDRRAAERTGVRFVQAFRMLVREQ